MHLDIAQEVKDYSLKEWVSAKLSRSAPYGTLHVAGTTRSAPSVAICFAALTATGDLDSACRNDVIRLVTTGRP